MRATTLLGMAWLCILWVASPGPCQDLPQVNAAPLIAEVKRLVEELGTAAERLNREEGSEKAVARLRAEAQMDEQVAFARLNLAAIVAALAGDEASACVIIQKELPVAREEELPQALARHVIMLDSKVGELARLSRIALAKLPQSERPLEEDLRRLAIVAGVLSELAPDSLELAQILHTIGACYRSRSFYDKAQDYYQRALAIRERLAPDSLDVAQSLVGIGRLSSERGDLHRALDCFQQALKLQERLAPSSLELAATLNNIGILYRHRGELDHALECHERALRIHEHLAPDSLDLAASLLAIGSVYYKRGDPEQALAYYQRALEIQQRRAPDSLDLAASLANIGLVYCFLGDLQRALECLERDLEITKRLAPDSLALASTLCNLGMVYHLRGDLDRALQYYEQDLEITERLAPDSLDLAVGLNDAGLVYWERGELDRALKYFERAVRIRERLAPDDLELAVPLANIADVYCDRGDLDRALEYYQRALKVRERVAPDSLDTSGALIGIGNVYYQRGDLDQALKYYQRDLEITEQLAPASLGLATSLCAVGAVCRKRGDFDRAVGYLNRGLAILDRLAPESADRAMCLSDLGQVAEAQGRLADALELHLRAVQVLERARERSASAPQSRSGFAARYVGIYHALVRVLLALGECEKAADLSERMRARSLLETLAERALSLDVLSQELSQRQANLDARRDRLYNELRGLAGQTPDEARSRAIAEELGRIALEQDLSTREVRAKDPRYAALQYPEPMTVAELAEALDPGTLVLSYVVGEDCTWLFVFGPGVKTQAFTIRIRAQDVQERVEECLAQVTLPAAPGPAQEGSAGGGTGSPAGRAEAALGDLGHLLLSPAAEVIARAQRLLILPDGPLWLLPFHALRLEDGSFLCDKLPVHYASSGTVFVEGRRLREGVPPGRELLALGDPDFMGPSGGQRMAYMPIRGAFRATQMHDGGMSLARLTFSGAEVQLIGELFRPSAQVRQGLLATEECVRKMAPGRRIVHLATHSLLDPASPMDSAVVLSFPRDPTPENDGFLKAWEAFGLDLKGCDLVTLSACETARGRALSGEGMIGLTRAFLYAGAASVLCTQWPVADESTAALMLRFYAHYRAGLSKDVALAKAMREIRTGNLEDGSVLELPEPLKGWRKQWAHPFYWAPFVLVGEYRTAYDGG